MALSVSQTSTMTRGDDLTNTVPGAGSAHDLRAGPIRTAPASSAPTKVLTGVTSRHCALFLHGIVGRRTDPGRSVVATSSVEPAGLIAVAPDGRQQATAGQ